MTDRKTPIVVTQRQQDLLLDMVGRKMPCDYFGLLGTYIVQRVYHELHELRKVSNLLRPEFSERTEHMLDVVMLEIIQERRPDFFADVPSIRCSGRFDITNAYRAMLEKDPNLAIAEDYEIPRHLGFESYAKKAYDVTNLDVLLHEFIMLPLMEHDCQSSDVHDTLGLNNLDDTDALNSFVTVFCNAYINAVMAAFHINQRRRERYDVSVLAEDCEGKEGIIADIDRIFGNLIIEPADISKAVAESIESDAFDLAEIGYENNALFNMAKILRRLKDVHYVSRSFSPIAVCTKGHHIEYLAVVDSVLERTIVRQEVISEVKSGARYKARFDVRNLVVVTDDNVKYLNPNIFRTFTEKHIHDIIKGDLGRDYTDKYRKVSLSSDVCSGF
ncbi:MAG: hypothetical protein ABIG89_02860 [Candidatus Woesearchaeota archaeon]